MDKTRAKIIPNLFLILVVAYLLFYAIALNFLTPTLYEVDGYYHLSAARFLKDFGPHYKFHWAQFSTFKDFFSDSYFLFHLSIIPFLLLTKNIVLAGKYAVIFYNILFLSVYIFILKKYLNSFLSGCVLLLPFLSSGFSFYFLLLKAVSLANILTVLSIYFLINKKWIKVFVLSLIYPLTHLSFFMVILFALICEVIRYVSKKEFFLKNVYIVILGSLIGCLAHPNFPNNLLVIHLNDILVPYLSITRANLDFGREAYSSPARFIFINNFAVFLTLGIILWSAFLTRVKVSLSTLVWWACSSVYLILAFLADRFWYITNILFFIFFASYLKDWLEVKKALGRKPRYLLPIAVYSVIIVIFMPANFRSLSGSLGRFIKLNTHYETVARFMRENIPPGELVYHTSWVDASYFLCLNPKDYYLVLCDPIYMFYRYPEIYMLNLKLRQGGINRPVDVIKGILKSRYGYVKKEFPLFLQISSAGSGFKIIYEDDLGAVFKVLD